VVLAVVMGVGEVGLGGIKFHNSCRDEQLLVWWPFLSHNAQGGGMRGGSGAAGSFLFLLPPAIAGGGGREYGGSGGGGGEDRNRHGEDFLWGRDHFKWM
jgi:hypothetical protein